MIGGKLRNGDVIVEVETKSTQNVAPPITKGQTYLAPIRRGTLAVGQNNIAVQPSGEHSAIRRVYPNWLRSSQPDSFGNYKYTLINQAHSKEIFDLIADPGDIQGSAGKFYSCTARIATYVISMPGHQDYITQPPIYLKLYATNGVKAQDTLIAQSGVINPAQASNIYWPFHPGKREIQVQLRPVAAMPTGKTSFRIAIEHASAWTATKDIWLPRHYYGSGTFPPQLAFAEMDFRQAHVFEEDPYQDWFSTSKCSYDWRDETVTTDGKWLQSFFEVDADSDLKTYGGRMEFYNSKDGIKFRAQGNGLVWTSAPIATGWASVVVPANVFQSTTDPKVILQLGHDSENTASVTLKQPRLFANIDYDDTDGFNYIKFANVVDAVSSIDISRQDSEVSTCTVELRDDSGIDTNDVFQPGKKIRVRSNVLLNEGADSWMGRSINPKNVVFTGEVDIRRVEYPRGARPFIKVTCSNAFKSMLEKTNFVMEMLDSYDNVFPYLGVSTVTDQGVFTPQSTDINVGVTGEKGYTGLWRLRDEQSNMSLLDAVTLTRNSQFGFVWFDRWNRLNLRSDVPTKTTVFTDKSPGANEFSFSYCNLNFGTDNIINYIDVNAFDQTYTVSDNKEVKFNVVKEEFSISDADSIKRNRKAQYKLELFKNWSYEDVQTKVLDKYKTPRMTIDTLRFPVRSMTELEQVTQMDIYENITVTYENKLNAERYRINRIEHHIVPGETWVTELGFGLKSDSVLW